MGDKEKLSYRPGMVLQGVYKSYGPRFGFLITDEDHEDVYIADRDHLNAVNNDIVEVRIKKGETGRHNTEGEVLRVIERAENTFVCTYEMTSFGGKAIPIDEKIDMVIEIPRGEELEAVTGARVIVEVTRWPGARANAEGKVTELIGYKGDRYRHHYRPAPAAPCVFQSTHGGSRCPFQGNKTGKRSGGFPQPSHRDY